MERRAFIASVAGLAAGSVAAAGSAAASGPHTRVLVRSHVTAIPAEAAARIAEAQAGGRLGLVRVHDRGFDPHSVAVHSDEGTLLGYLPGVHSRILAPLMEHGLTLHARTVAVRSRPRPRLEFDVILSV
jgi:hypothetical protein